MAITHTVQKNWNGTLGLPIQATATMTADYELNFDMSVPGPTTNMSIALAFVLAKLQSIYITSDQPLTIKTNSSSVPQETLTLAAGGVYEWDVNSGITNPFLGAVTVAFVTVAGSTAANLKIRTAQNH